MKLGDLRSESSGAAAPWIDRVLAGTLFAAASSVYLLFSYTRHANFGSGSWDLGCYSQSAWLASRLLPLDSSLLGGLHVFGDHFIPIIYVLAPIFWLSGDTGALLAVQALAVASIAFPLYALGRRTGLGRSFALGIAGCFLFALGTQSAIAFDFHHLTLGIAFYAYAFYFLETDRPWTAAPFLLLLALCRESAPIYVAFLGLHIAFFRGRRLLGGWLFVGGCWAFYVVLRWVMPHFNQGVGHPLPHLMRFEAFGGTIEEVVASGLAHPIRTIAIALTPAVKLTSLLATAGTFAFLGLLAPRFAVLALPFAAERFLSSKVESWGMEFHYSLPLTLVSALAAIEGAARLKTLVEPRRIGAWLAIGCVASTLLIDGWTQTAEFAHWHKAYFSKHADTNRRALALVPLAASVAAQDHFVPHLALRREVWMLREARRAEYVVASPDEGTWPYTRDDVVGILRALLAAGYRPVFSEGMTVVLRKGAPPGVPLAAELSTLLE